MSLPPVFFAIIWAHCARIMRVKTASSQPDAGRYTNCFHKIHKRFDARLRKQRFCQQKALGLAYIRKQVIIVPESLHYVCFR